MDQCAAELLSSWPGREVPALGSRACGATAAAFSHPAAWSACFRGTGVGGSPPFISRFIREGVQEGEPVLFGELRQTLEKSFPELSRRGRGAGQRGFANKVFGFFARCLLSGHSALACCPAALGGSGSQRPAEGCPAPPRLPGGSAFGHGRVSQPQRRDLRADVIPSRGFMLVF